MISTSAVPMCTTCSRSRTKFGRVRMVTFLALLIVVAGITGFTFPRDYEWLAFVVTLGGALVLMMPLASAAWSNARGHVAGCRAAALAGRGFVFGNRAFARQVGFEAAHPTRARSAGPPAPGPD